MLPDAPAAVLDHDRLPEQLAKARCMMRPTKSEAPPGAKGMS